MSLHKVIGIDLGTTYSAVASWDTDEEEARVITDHGTGKATIPSVVSMDPLLQKAIVGANAKQNLPNDPNNTVLEIKREMGEEFSVDTLKKYRAEGVYEAADPVRAHFAGQWLLPQEISGFILMRMKEVAEAEAGEEIRDAVITVPAYFKEKQKSATKEAALLAGLYPRQLIPEPTAAAICYGVDRDEQEKRVYLVYDLGGGTFDVSIIEVRGQDITVVATAGDPRLGGGDFDDVITDWAVTQLKEAPHEIDVDNNATAKARIKLKAEDAKIDLADNVETTISLIELDAQKAPTVKLTREKMEELVTALLKKSLVYVESAMNKAEQAQGIKREDVHAILLVGGSTKMPLVRRMLLDYFGKGDDFVRSDVNPDEAVARGAAILANRFAPSPPPFDPEQQPDASLTRTDTDDDLNIQLITEHSLGIAVKRGPEIGVFAKIIRQGENIPISRTQGGFANEGPTTDLDVHVFQGEDSAEYVQECTEIGKIPLGPMEPQPRGHHQFEVTFSLDVNGLLSATVHHINEKKTYEAQWVQKAGVGGAKRLATLHRKLVGMYGGAGSPAAAAEEALPPPQPTPQGPTDGEATEVPPPPATPQPAASPAPSPTPSASAEGEETAMVLPRVDVPDEFKSIRRRAQKQIERKFDGKLLAAYNAFVTALNNGIAGDELEELGDQLEDAYHDARA